MRSLDGGTARGAKVTRAGEGFSVGELSSNPRKHKGSKKGNKKQKCIECGAELRSGNPGPRCSPCQEKITQENFFGKKFVPSWKR